MISCRDSYRGILGKMKGRTGIPAPGSRRENEPAPGVGLHSRPVPVESLPGEKKRELAQVPSFPDRLVALGLHPSRYSKPDIPICKRIRNTAFPGAVAPLLPVYLHEIPYRAETTVSGRKLF